MALKIALCITGYLVFCETSVISEKNLHLFTKGEKYTRIIASLEASFDTTGVLVHTNDYCLKHMCTLGEILTLKSFLSASLVSRRYPFLFMNKEGINDVHSKYHAMYNTSIGHVGVIFDNKVLDNATCAYPSDSASEYKPDGCGRRYSKEELDKNPKLRGKDMTPYQNVSAMLKEYTMRLSRTALHSIHARCPKCCTYGGRHACQFDNEIIIPTVYAKKNVVAVFYVSERQAQRKIGYLMAKRNAEHVSLHAKLPLMMLDTRSSTPLKLIKSQLRSGLVSGL